MYMEETQHRAAIILQIKNKQINLSRKGGKKLQTINAEEGVKKREPSYRADGSVNWYSHYGEQYGGSFKN